MLIEITILRYKALFWKYYCELAKAMEVQIRIAFRIMFFIEMVGI